MFSSGDIAELEKQYSKYKLKKRAKKFLFFLILIIISLALSYFFIYYKNDKSKIILVNKKQMTNIEVNKTITEKNNSLKNDKVASLYINKSNIPKISLNEDNKTKILTNEIIIDNNVSKIDKSVNKEIKQIIFHIKPSNDLSFKNINRGTLNLNISTYEVKKNIVKISNTTKIDKNDIIKESNSINKNIQIEMEDINSIKELKDKYNATHNIKFSLMLCEEYYAKKDFKNSLKWSIISNDLNSGSEKSWIWFAKSKYRLNEKDDAIKALRAYLKSNKSAAVESLLHDIINGELND